MAELTRPGNVVPFASGAQGGERTVFGDLTSTSDTIAGNLNADFIRGWVNGVNIDGFPPEEFFNALGYVQSALSTYLFQRGTAEWNAAQEMYHPAITLGSNGVLYHSVTTLPLPPNAVNPINDAARTHWSPVGFQTSGTTTTEGVVRQATAPELTNRSNVNAYVPPDALPVAASTTVPGLVEQATNTEASTGSDDQRFMTPAQITSRINSIVDGLSVPPRSLVGRITTGTIPVPSGALRALITATGGGQGRDSFGGDTTVTVGTSLLTASGGTSDNDGVGSATGSRILGTSIRRGGGGPGSQSQQTADGGYIQAYVDVSLITSISVNIGSGGAGNIASNRGANGEASAIFY